MTVVGQGASVNRIRRGGVASGGYDAGVSEKRAFWIAGLLLVLMAVEVGLSTRRMSLSWDEGDHIYSGYVNWKEGSYAMNPEHPPLVKLLATLPLLPLKLKLAPRTGRMFKDEAYFGGRELLYRNDPKYGGGYSADSLLFRVHMAAMVFALALAWLVFLAGTEMFGWQAGLLAMALFVFDPTMVANAPYVATDMGGAWGMFAGVYTFYRFVQRRTPGRAIVCGVVTGLALGTKHSEVVLPGVLALLGVAVAAGDWWRMRGGRAETAPKASGDEQALRRDTLRLVAGLAGICGLALLVLWGIYGFRFAMHGTGIDLPPLAKSVRDVPPLPRALITIFAAHHLLPESYLYGLADVLSVGVATPTFLMGKVYAHGLWYYFPAILSLKWTVGTLGLLAIAVWGFARANVRRGREVLFMTLPPALFLAVAKAGPLNIGVRHVLPLFPFVFVLAAAGAMLVARQSRFGAAVVGLLLVWHVADSVRLFPDYQSYGNTLWRGPARTHEYFSDSAVDWGQQLKEVKAWTDKHGVRECWFAYFVEPFVQQADYGIPCKALPTFDSEGQEDLTVPEVVHGPVLVSVGDVNGFEFATKVRNPYQELFERKPDELIANAVAVYYGDFRLPLASAMEFQMRSHRALAAGNPGLALEEARKAVAVAPEGFDANLALGDALVKMGNGAEARSAYAVAVRRVDDMEPSAQAQWRPVVEKKIAMAK